jgi:hypothetical protein
MLDRGALLSRYRFEWPVFDAAFFALSVRWLMLAVAVAGAAWLILGALGRRRDARALTKVTEETV